MSSQAAKKYLSQKLKGSYPEYERKPYYIKESQVILLNFKVHGSRHVDEKKFLLIIMKSLCSIENQRPIYVNSMVRVLWLEIKIRCEGVNLARVTIVLLALSKETPSRSCWKRPSKKKIARSCMMWNC